MQPYLIPLLEQWMEYKGGYLVSSHGRVYSTKSRKFIKFSSDRKGYLLFTQSLGSHKEYIRVHRLVALLFLGNIPNGYEVNHRNENKADNNVLNLEIVTRLDNLHYGSRCKRIGLLHRKPILQFDVKGNFIRRYLSIKEAEKFRKLLK